MVLHGLRPIGFALLLASTVCSAAALAASNSAPTAQQAPLQTSTTAAPPEPSFGYAHLYGALSFGRGLRFNNPYRLQTQLGDSAESLSWTAPYLDLSIGALLGEPHGLQHGAAVHASFALEGIRQEVLTPSYVTWLPLSPRWHARGRVGIPIVIEPDASAGLELALGAAFLATAGLGLTAEIVGSLFPGAATAERPQTLIPILSFQLGVLINYEVLP